MTIRLVPHAGPSGIFRTCACLLLAWLCAGCGRHPPSLTCMLWGDATDLQHTRRIVAEFEKRNGAHVELIIFPWENYETKLKLMISADILPDIIFVDRNVLIDIYDMDAVLPMNTFIQNDPDLDWQDFLFRDVVTINGEIMGLPEDGGGIHFVFNRDIFRALKMRDPLQIYLENADDWNLQTFERMARSITRDLNGDGRYDLYGCYHWTWMMPLLSNFYIHGGNFINEDCTEITIRSPECLEAIRFLAGLYQPIPDPDTDQMCPPAFQDPREKSDVPGATGFSFQAGNVAMGPMIPFVAIKDYFEERFTFDWDIVPFPRGPAGFKVAGGGNPVCITKTAKNPDLAYAFAKHWTSKETQSNKVRERLYFFPSRRSVIQDEAFHRHFDKIHSAVFLSCIDENRMVPFPTEVRNLRKILRILKKEIHDCMLGLQTPEETVDKLQPALEQTLREGRGHMRRKPSYPHPSGSMQAKNKGG